MNCPTDGTPLVMTDRSGIEIDYCPQCRGVWLDRGELDKIVERSVGVQAGPATRAPTAQPYTDPGYGYNTRGGHHGSRRKRGWLGELFD